MSEVPYRKSLINITRFCKCFFPRWLLEVFFVNRLSVRVHRKTKLSFVELSTEILLIFAQALNVIILIYTPKEDYHVSKSHRNRWI